LSDYEEVKTLGEVTCPQCQNIITVKRRTTYNQKEPRRKQEEELFAEPSIQTTLDQPKARKREKAEDE